jgi:molybdopterin adenylyltransferase
MKIDVGIITVSDRAARGEYEDLGGPAVRDAARKHGWMPIEEIVVPDDQARIQEAIRQLASHGRHLILTTGGTGVSPRDVTPEAVRAIASRELQGFGEAMRMESRKLTPHGILSRSLAAVVGNTLVICLPGKPSGAVECLGFVAPAVPHCIEVLRQIPATC